MAESSNLPWKHQREYTKETIDYLKARKSGKVSSLKTPWPRINKSSINGFERNTVTVFAGRPSHGKTAMAEQLIKTLEKYNKRLRLKTLHFNFEMVGRSSKIRELTSVTKKTYAELCSADIPLDDETLSSCEKYLDEIKNRDIDIVDQAITVDRFKQVVEQYMKHNAEEVQTVNGPRKRYRNTLIVIDHSLLFKMKKGQNDKKEMLFELGEILNELKKKYPIWFLVLSQLNRNITDPIRNKSQSAGNYITDGDLYGADALMQFADNIYAITIPARRNIDYYGPDGYIIEDTTVVVHIIKSRSGEVGITFLKANFKEMEMLDSETPGLVTPKNVRQPNEIIVEQK